LCEVLSCPDFVETLSGGQASNGGGIHSNHSFIQSLRQIFPDAGQFTPANAAAGQSRIAAVLTGAVLDLTPLPNPPDFQLSRGTSPQSPFVMNSRREIQEAIEEYQLGKWERLPNERKGYPGCVDNGEDTTARGFQAPLLEGAVVAPSRTRIDVFTEKK